MYSIKEITKKIHDRYDVSSVAELIDSLEKNECLGATNYEDNTKKACIEFLRSPSPYTISEILRRLKSWSDVSFYFEGTWIVVDGKYYECERGLNQIIPNDVLDLYFEVEEL